MSKDRRQEDEVELAIVEGKSILARPGLCCRIVDVTVNVRMLEPEIGEPARDLLLAPADFLGCDIKALVPRVLVQPRRQRHGHPACTAADVKNRISALQSPDFNKQSEEFFASFVEVTPADALDHPCRRRQVSSISPGEINEISGGIVHFPKEQSKRPWYQPPE